MDDRPNLGINLGTLVYNRTAKRDRIPGVSPDRYNFPEGIMGMVSPGRYDFQKFSRRFFDCSPIP